MEQEKKTYRTYFGSFKVSCITEKVPYPMMLLDFKDTPISEGIYVDENIKISPTGRFLLVIAEDKYAGTGSFGFTVADLLTEEIISVYYHSLEPAWILV